MPAFEVLALDTATPQIRAPGAGDTYTFPRAITPSGANVTPFTVSGYSLTGANAQSMFDLSGTWNTSGTPTALKLNITDTASNAASLLMDLQTGGTSRFQITKAGALWVNVGTRTTGFSSDGRDVTVNSGTLRYNFNFSTQWEFSGLSVTVPNLTAGVSGRIGFGSNGDISNFDAGFARDAANTVAQRNGLNAQTKRIYGTYTDASNYERGYFTADSNGLTIGHEALGTGVKRPVRIVGPSLASAEAVSVLDMSQTWNTTGTPTAIKLNITDTASNASSLLMDLQVGGSTRFNVRKDGTVNLSTNAPYINVPTGFAALQFGGANVFVWQSGAVRVNGVDLQIGATDTILTRDAANTLAQRNSTNAQTFRVYNTYTDASNYERTSLGWSSNSFKIITEPLGTGAQRDLVLGADYPGNITISTRLTLRSGGQYFALGRGHSLENDLVFKQSGFNNTTLTLVGGTEFGWSSGGADLGSDTVLTRDAANTVAQRRGTNAQTFRVYNTFTDLSNYERGKIAWSSNVLQIGTEKAGTGTARAVNLQTDGTTRVTLGASGGITLADANDVAVGSTTGTKIGTATTQKLGFWNAAPIVQPDTGVAAATVAATGAGDVVAASTTFDGYTIPQIVKALRNAGLLA